MDLAEASRQYQIALEHTRTVTSYGIDEDDDAQALLDADKHLEIAWLHHALVPSHQAQRKVA
jgi:hypothetical protein